MALSEQTLKKIWKVFLLTIAIMVIAYFTYFFSDVIIMLAISMLLALIFNPLISFLEKHGIHRLISILLVFILTGGVMIFGFSVLIPKIIYQINMISHNVNEQNVNFLVKETEALITKYVPFVNSTEIIQKMESSLYTLFLNSIDNLSNIVTSIFSILAISIIVPFMTFFLLKDRVRITKGIINVMPNRYFEVSYWTIKQISDQLGRFVRGWIFDAFIVGTLAAIGLTILGIKNSVTIGLIAGIGHLIPYFGPVIGGIPAIIISVIQFGDFSKLPSIFLMFVIIYSIDNGYIQPNIFSKVRTYILL